MKSAQGLIGIGLTGLIGSATVLLTSGGAIAAAKVTGVQVNSTATGMDLVLQTQGSDRPQVFSVNRGNIWTADLVNTRLQLPGGKYQKDNPTAGIARVTVASLDNNSVRVTVVGQGNAPTGQVNRSNNGTLTFNLSRSTTSASATVTGAKPSIKSANLSRVTQQGTITQQPTASTPLPALPNTLAQATTPPPGSAAPVSPLPPFQGGSPLVPSPTIQVQGVPTAPPPPVPPFAPVPLPRAVAPPVGDIAVGQIDSSLGSIDLGTAERVPRLVLRDASSREVLSLLARSAGLNIVFTGDQPQQGGQPPQPGQPVATDGPKVTLDIVNEPIQNVFNYVLQVTGLEASRRGNTIFVGTRLPNTARNVIIRSMRLNQIPVTNALNFLVGLGAESSVTRERLVTSVNAIPVTQLQGTAQAAPITQSQTTTEQRVEVQRVNFTDSTPFLRGLQVSGDERTNTLTLIGESRKVDIAIAQLTQLDVRRRQVAVNVRVIDIDLIALDRLGTSFSFGIGDTQVSNQGGIGFVNFGRGTPATTGLASDLTGSTIGTPTFARNGISNAGFVRDFFLQLQAAVTNGSAKVLTDPTLVVQEGQRSEVRLTEEVITNIVQNITGGSNNTPPTVTITVQKASAGLILPVQIDRIDDNGFVSLSIAPSIAAPSSSANIQTPGSGSVIANNQITLLSERRVQSGQFRLRDGQTLVLSGIIQDEDRTTVTKVPILGDIPILGALFRRTNNQNRRREVVVLVTPRVLDDTDNSAFGYSYTPGVETRRVLQNQQR